jgi:Rha family phage regulatory protein
MSIPLVLPHTEVLTMSSREIAELTGKRHDNVMADTRKMLFELYGDGGVLNFQDTHTNEQNGQSYPIFKLPKRETLILVSGYNIQMRAKIIDRWQELEVQAMPHLVSPLPDRRQLALMILEAEEEIAAKNLKIAQQKAVIAVTAPKADALDLLMEKEGKLSLTCAAKTLKVGPKQFIQYLIDNKWLYRTGPKSDLSAMQDKLNRGLLEQKLVLISSTTGAETIRHQAVVTPKGMAFLGTALAAFRLEA